MKFGCAACSPIFFGDTLGSGVRNLVKYTKLYSGGEPELTVGEIFRSVIPLGTNVPTDIMQPDKNHELSVTRQVTDKVIDATEKVTEDESKLLVMLSQNGKITHNELATHLGVSRKPVSTWIRTLKEKNLIRRIGSDKKGHWEVTDGSVS